MAMEYYIKNLSEEIQLECKRKEIECHENFMHYYLNLLALDPFWKLHPKMNEIIRVDALRMITFVVKQMACQHCPSIIALKMRFYFYCNCKSKEELIEVDEYNFNTRLKPLTDEIVESEPTDEEEYDMLLKRIIYYTALWRRLGNPMQELVYKEMYHAMISIIDESDLNMFVQSKQEEKIDILKQFANICSGVRLFNWATKKNGEGIDDLPKVLLNLITEFRLELTNKFEKNMDKIDLLTTAIDSVFLIDEHERTGPEGDYIEYTQSCYIPETIEYEEIEFYKDLIVVHRGIEGFYRIVYDLIEEMDATIINLNEQFAECLSRFYKLEHLKSGVLTSVIFPMFIDLDLVWKGFQNEIAYVKKLMHILVDLDIYIKDFTIDSIKMEAIIEDNDILTDADRQEMPDIDVFSEDDFEYVKIIQPRNKEFDLNNMYIEFGGFDVWRMVESQGGLIPGNPYIGILKYDDRYYVFSCRQSAFMFAENPQRLINEALELARKKVVLIPLLKLEEDLAKVQTINQLVIDAKLTASNIAHSNSGVQTDTHPVTRCKDPTYLWNIWDYKRQAIMLADMSKRMTKGTLTDKNNSGCRIATQTYLNKPKAVQTLKDNYTNTHTPQTYFFGLRGRRDDKQFILDLTKPVDKS